MDRKPLTRFALLSLAAAIVTITLKLAAWYITGSVGMLSDALESIVNVVAAAATLWLLYLSARPPDDRHTYGYSKAEYFASAFEGALILVAALLIAWSALERLRHPQPIEQVGLGVVVSLVATAINFGVARVLLGAARRHYSIALEADAHHLMTDVWTSIGVVVAVFAVSVTGWNVLDPIIALAVAANIVFTGVSLLRRSAFGLMDEALPADRVARIEQVLDRYRAEGSNSMRFVHVPRRAARSSRCTFSCRVRGRSSGATISSRRSSTRSPRPRRGPPFSPISNHSRTRSRMATRGSTVPAYRRWPGGALPVQ
jgi:cation diffusion facilitator family transporter